MTTVLIVDDDLDAAQDYATLVNRGTGLSATASDDPDVAATLVEAGGVAVLILDQQMPATSGTDLFVRLRDIDPRVRGVLLTGEATSDEVGDALNRGFSRYVPKPQALSQLAAVVRHEYIEYQNSLLLDVSAEQPVLVRRRKWWPLGSTTSIRFRGFEILNESLVRDSDWREVLTLQAGQTQRTTLSRTEAWTLQMEQEVTARIASEYSLGVEKVAKLTGKLQSEVAERFKKSMTNTISQSVESEETFTLPAEPADVETLHVRARRVQQAPVLISARVELLEECNSCKRPHLLTIRALIDTGTLALRHVDQLSDGSTREVRLGTAGTL